ncbi:hypothetical protein HN028_14220 [Pantoea ananatis]|uniref:hypothetical protein n=1 Tax=Pantoea ananas TaxID=553 RepID=UPI00352AC333
MKTPDLIFTKNMIVNKDYKQLQLEYNISFSTACRTVKHFKNSDEPLKLFLRGKNKPVKTHKNNHISLFLGTSKEYSRRFYYHGKFVQATYEIKDDSLIIKFNNKELEIELSSFPVLIDKVRKNTKNIQKFSDHVVYSFTDVSWKNKTETASYELRSQKKIFYEDLEDIFEQTGHHNEINQPFN